MQMWRGKMVKGEVGQDFGQSYANFVVNGGIVDDNIVNDNIVDDDIDNYIRNDAIAYFDEKPKNMLGGDDLGNDDVDDDDTGNDNIDDKPEHVLSGDNRHLAQLALLQRHL